MPSGQTPECGYLTVPESREHPEEGSIRIHVAVFKSASSAPAPDPVVYLDGGPGGSTLETVQYSFDSYFAPFLDERDVVLFDQRGVGTSEPALDCPEANDVTRNAIRDPISAKDAVALYVAAFAACHQRFVDQGITLDAYNSKENAADVAELRQALGYNEWNVYGISYGTKLALTYMRDSPEGIRSVVLDSTYPLQVDGEAELVPNAHRSIQTLLDGCAADAECGSLYPNLATALYDVVERLDQQPATADVIDPLTGNSLFQASITGDELLGALFLALYNEDLIPALPRVIALADDGDYGPLGIILGLPIISSEFISGGMNASVQCHEEVAFSSPAAVAENAAPYPELRGFVDGSASFPLCEVWDVGKADAQENQAVSSDINTLIYAGEYDPITPPVWGQIVAADLPRSHFFQFPGLGHGASTSGGCPHDMLIAFLRQPDVAPDSSCIQSMGPPDFVIF